MGSSFLLEYSSSLEAIYIFLDCEAHSHTFREKLHFGKKVSRQNGLETTPKSPISFYLPALQKGREATKLHTHFHLRSYVHFKSCQETGLVLRSHSALFPTFRKKFHSEKKASLQGLGHNSKDYDFPVSLKYLLSTLKTLTAASPCQNN